MFQRWAREFRDFFFTKGNALHLAIAVVVGRQFQAIVDVLTKDLLMPLINPFVPQGSWKDMDIPYFGGAIHIGLLLDVAINSLITAWALFLLFKAIKRIEQAGEQKTGGDQSQGS